VVFFVNAYKDNDKSTEQLDYHSLLTSRIDNLETSCYKRKYWKMINRSSLLLAMAVPPTNIPQCPTCIRRSMKCSLPSRIRSLHPLFIISCPVHTCSYVLDSHVPGWIPLIAAILNLTEEERQKPTLVKNGRFLRKKSDVAGALVIGLWKEDRGNRLEYTWIRIKW